MASFSSTIIFQKKRVHPLLMSLIQAWKMCVCIHVLYVLTKGFCIGKSAEAGEYDALYVTVPKGREDNACASPVFQKDTQELFLNTLKNTTLNLWTGIQRYQLQSPRWGQQKATNFGVIVAPTGCVCSFMEAKGFPSSLSEGLSVNHCSQKYGYICQKQECSGCSDTNCLWDRRTCFIIQCSISEWESARRHCLENGGDLAVIKSKLVQDGVKKKAFDLCQKVMRKFWVGMTNCWWLDIQEDEPTVVTSTLWLSGQPSSEGNCAVRSLTSDGRVGLQVEPCDSLHRFLCANRTSYHGGILTTDYERETSVHTDDISSPQSILTNTGPTTSPSFPLLCLLLTIFSLTKPAMLANHHACCFMDSLPWFACQ